MSAEYDVVIVGGGAAGLQLALKLTESEYFNDQRILIIDKSDKTDNDRTWCIWETGETRWDTIAAHMWDHGQFIGPNGDVLPFQMRPYRYKMIQAADFYAYAKDRLKSSGQVDWVIDAVSDIHDDRTVIAEGDRYRGRHVFDSRVDPAFFAANDTSVRLLQHFKGWVIESSEPVFNPVEFTMMDYRLQYEQSTSFIYVLPTSSTRALVEYTFFTADVVEESVYDEMMRIYIRDYLHIESFEIINTEQGVIPMTNYDFRHHHRPGITKIGTAGGWVKGSTGYSFKNADRYTSLIRDALIAGKDPSKAVQPSRFHYYDTLFLDVLARHNEMGPELFYTMYKRNDISRILKFLDNQTSFAEDLTVMNTFDWTIFLKAIVRQLFR